MKKVKYTGGAHVRTIDANAFKAVGVDDQNKVVFDRRPGKAGLVQEVSDAAADHLVNNDTFELVEDDQDAKAEDSKSDASDSSSDADTSSTSVPGDADTGDGVATSSAPKGGGSTARGRGSR